MKKETEEEEEDYAGIDDDSTHARIQGPTQPPHSARRRRPYHVSYGAFYGSSTHEA